MRRNRDLTHATAPTRRIALALLLGVVALLTAFAGIAEAKTIKGTPVKVMTRNLYLGADLTPAIQSTSRAAFFEANGAILRTVDASNFPVRAKGLAAENLEEEPDLVGLQEVALWRTAEPSAITVQTGIPTATTVKYDFLQLLLDQLNKGGTKYKAVVVNPEFDFEAPADYNGLPHDGPGGGAPGLLENTEINGRLTMRDVILAKVHAGVTVSNPRMGHYSHLLVEEIAGAFVLPGEIGQRREVFPALLVIGKLGLEIVVVDRLDHAADHLRRRMRLPARRDLVKRVGQLRPGLRRFRVGLSGFLGILAYA